MKENYPKITKIMIYIQILFIVNVANRGIPENLNILIKLAIATQGLTITVHFLTM